MPFRIVWPVDLFAAGDSSIQRAVARAILPLIAGIKDVEVQPLTLFGSYAFELPTSVNKNHGRYIYLAAQKKLDRILESVKIPGLLPLKTMGLPFPSLRENTEEVLEFARRWQADLIVLGTHGRRGAQRWLMGSFTETLSFHSEIPLYVVNPHWSSRKAHRPHRLKNILFPTDFSPTSQSVLSQVLNWAKIWEASVTLFHRVQVDIHPGMESAFGSHGIYANSLGLQLQRVQALGEHWLERIRTQGLRGELNIDQKGSRTVAEAIIKAARTADRNTSHGCVIAIAGQSGAISSVLLGSVTRQVLRMATVPVWVMHGPAKRLNVAKVKYA